MADNVIESFLIGLGFDFSEQDSKRLARSFNRVSSALAKVTTLAAGAAASITAAITAPVNDMRAMARAAKTLGMSTGALSGWEGAFQRVGLAAGTATGALTQLFDKQTRLKLGQTDPAFMNALGMLQGKPTTKVDLFKVMQEGSPEEFLQATADAVSMLADEGEQFVLSQQLGLGDSLDWLRKERAERERILELETAKGLVTDARAKRAEAFGRAWKDALDGIKSVIFALQDRLLPKLTARMHQFTAWFHENDIAGVIGSWVDKFFELNGEIWLVITALGVPLLGALKKVGASVAVILKGFKGIGKGLMDVAKKVPGVGRGAGFLTSLIPVAGLGVAALGAGTGAREGLDADVGIEGTGRLALIGALKSLLKATQFLLPENFKNSVDTPLGVLSDKEQLVYDEAAARRMMTDEHSGTATTTNGDATVINNSNTNTFNIAAAAGTTLEQAQEIFEKVVEKLNDMGGVNSPRMLNATTPGVQAN